jgi:hypothetical protein
MRAGRELTRSHGCFRFLAMTRLWLKLAGVGKSDMLQGKLEGKAQFEWLLHLTDVALLLLSRALAGTAGLEMDRRLRAWN